jgi:hypothetical protein
MVEFNENSCERLFNLIYLDFIHPDDVEKVREQLNLQAQDGSPNSGGAGRILDLKTGTVKKDGHAASARLGKFLLEYLYFCSI